MTTGVTAAITIAMAQKIHKIQLQRKLGEASEKRKPNNPEGSDDLEEEVRVRKISLQDIATIFKDSLFLANLWVPCNVSDCD